MKVMNIEGRFDLPEFQQDLQLDNSDYSRLLIQDGLTREQCHLINDVFDEYRSMIENGEEIQQRSFEERIYRVVPQHSGNHQFVEALAFENHKRVRCEEVFESLYGENPKFQYYLNSID